MKIYQKPKYHEYRWRTWLKPLVPADGTDRRFLDLGCNAGFYMLKAKKMGYSTIGVEKDLSYLAQAPSHLNISHEDINNYQFPISYLTLMACVHYHQTEEQVEALLHNLTYSTANLLIMGRHYGRTTSPPDRQTIMHKMKGWKYLGGVSQKQFYTVLFKNPRYQELDVEELYQSTKQFTTTLSNFVDFVPAFTEFVRYELDGIKINNQDTEFYKYLIRRRLRYPLGRCCIYKKLVHDLKDNGINRALKVQDGRISDGYHRLIILKELGVKRVICKTRGKL